MEKCIGDWIEVDDKIYEITGETDGDYIVREVLYNTPNKVIPYGETTVISKADAPTEIVINPEDAELDALIEEVIDAETLDE